MKAYYTQRTRGDQTVKIEIDEYGEMQLVTKFNENGFATGVRVDATLLKLIKQVIEDYEKE